MGEFNFFDLAASAFVLISAYLAYVRGMVREFMAIAGWIVSAVAAYFLAPQATPLVGQLPVVGPYFEGSCEITIIVAFTLVFAAALIICSAVTALLNRMTTHTGLGILNQGMGMVFGVVRGIFVIAVVLILHDAIFSGGQSFSVVSESRSNAMMYDLQLRIRELIPSNAGSRFSVIYNNVTAICSAGPQPDTVPVETPLIPSSSNSGLSI